jgi:hypothetical protein
VTAALLAPALRAHERPEGLPFDALDADGRAFALRRAERLVAALGARGLEVVATAGEAVDGEGRRPLANGLVPAGGQGVKDRPAGGRAAARRSRVLDPLPRPEETLGKRSTAQSVDPGAPADDGQGAPRGKHRWGEPARHRTKTERVCLHCGLVKVTRHEPGRRPWLEWWRGLDKIVSDATPPCGGG